jgi:hypothetical protein
VIADREGTLTSPEPHRRRIDIVTDPDFTAGIENIPLDELRERRLTCDDLDTELSYYRRLLHGRMDLLAFELRRRSGEEERSLIEALPEILAGSETVADREPSGVPRALPIETPDIPLEGRRTIDRVLGDDFLARLPSLEHSELERIQGLLTEAEAEISNQRKAVYEAYELIHAELTRRYREGLADVTELLESS